MYTEISWKTVQFCAPSYSPKNNTDQQTGRDRLKGNSIKILKGPRIDGHKENAVITITTISKNDRVLKGEQLASIPKLVPIPLEKGDF